MLLTTQSIFALVPQSKKSLVTESIDPAHVAYISRKLFPRMDRRGPGRYDFADVASPALTALWDGFEASYQAAPRFEEFWTAELEDVVVHPPFGLVTIGDVIVRETVRDSAVLAGTFPGLDPQLCRQLLAGRAPRLEVPDFEVGQSLDEPAFQLGTGLAENYFNWSLRYLSKVAIFQRVLKQRPGLRLLAPAPKQGFIPRSLEFFRVAQDDVRWLTARTRMRRLTLSAPSAIGRYNLSPMLPRALRQHEAVTQVWREDRALLYVPRGTVRMRRVVNEPEVIAHLRKRGFRIFDAGAHPIGEQVRAFKNAAMVIGPHGAALTNIVYCARGTPVIEVVPEGYDQSPTSYRSLSDMFDLPYAHMVGRENPQGVRRNRCNSDFFISIPHLDRLIDDFMPRR
ncbi:glycosyltransferase family 61 protein [Xanthobacter sp. V4C-4]|uniref:glycosyltransferase family 61 protein n=1 Tax=Xanthobacter cornucopiae TaxID=3119924 RepID=UPI0037283668